LADGKLVKSCIADVAEKFGDVSCMECTGQGNDFELIAIVKWKLDIP